MSFTNTKSDGCFLHQQASSNKSIFNYVVDPNKFKNDNECNNFTAPFLTYIPTGVVARNVDIENDLKGMTRPYTRCTAAQYSPATTPQSNDVYPQNKKECTVKQNILPNGYINTS